MGDMVQAEIKDGKLFYTDSFNQGGIPTVFNLAELLESEELALIKQDNFGGIPMPMLSVHLREEGKNVAKKLRLCGVKFEDLKAHFPNMISLDALTYTTSSDQLSPEEMFEDLTSSHTSRLDELRHAALTSAANSPDRISENGHPQDALILPSAVERVEDNGAYRSIIFKDKFKTFSTDEIVVWTPLTVEELHNLNIRGSVTQPPQPSTQELH